MKATYPLSYHGWRVGSLNKPWLWLRTLAIYPAQLDTRFASLMFPQRLCQSPAIVDRQLTVATLAKRFAVFPNLFSGFPLQAPNVSCQTTTICSFPGTKCCRWGLCESRISRTRKPVQFRFWQETQLELAAPTLVPCLRYLAVPVHSVAAFIRFAVPSFVQSYYSRHIRFGQPILQEGWVPAILRCCWFSVVVLPVRI